MKKANHSKYLQCTALSKYYPFKVCVVARTKKRLWVLRDDVECAFRIAKEKRCGYAGFYYFNTIKEAIELRKKLYNEKDLFVFLQDDRPLCK